MAYLASYRMTMLIMAALIALIALLCLWLLSRRTAHGAVKGKAGAG